MTLVVQAANASGAFRGIDTNYALNGNVCLGDYGASCWGGTYPSDANVDNVIRLFAEELPNGVSKPGPGNGYGVLVEVQPDNWPDSRIVIKASAFTVQFPYYSCPLSMPKEK
jgi:hypothetical protein